MPGAVSTFRRDAARYTPVRRRPAARRDPLDGGARSRSALLRGATSRHGAGRSQRSYAAAATHSPNHPLRYNGGDEAEPNSRATPEALATRVALVDEFERLEAAFAVGDKVVVEGLKA